MGGNTETPKRWSPTDHPTTRGVRLRFHVKGKVLLPSNKGQLMAPIHVQENRESSSRKVVVADRLSWRPSQALVSHSHCITKPAERTMSTTSVGPWGFSIFLCLRQVPCFRAIMKARGLLCLAAHATGQAEPEVNIRPMNTRHNNSLRGRVSKLSGALSVSSTLHLSAIVWSRTNETLLYSGAFPTNAQGVVDISAGPKMRGHISGQISSGLGMTTASVTAMPTRFPSGCGVARTRPFWYISQSLHEKRASWTTSMGWLRHMPVHPLKAWLFSEWWMPVASTGVSTSSVNISAGGAGHYHIVSDQSRPVENCADWTTRAFSLVHSGTKPGLPGDHAMHFVVDCLSKSIPSVNIPMGINSTSST